MSSLARYRLSSISAVLITLFSMAALLITIISFAAPSSTHAQFDPLEPGCRNAGASGVCNAPGDDPLVGDEGLLTTVTNILTIVTAVAAVIVIIIAGLTMTLSGGNSQKIQQSRDAIIYAAVAIAVAALARTVVLFVASRL